jgi:hypothetical protein
MLSQVTKKDIERLIYENIPIEKNPNYPNLESSGWKWKKYADGTVEAWYKKNQDITITTASEDNFFTSVETPFPFTIYDAVGNINAFSWTGTAGWTTWDGGKTINETTISFFVFTPTSTTRNTNICAHVTGRWK